MSFMDDLGGKAKDFADQNPDKLNEAAQKGGDFVDEKTGGQYTDQIDKGQQFAQDRFGGGADQTDQAGQADQSGQTDQQQ